jgi:YidC/Oxa1 family membrane protein insertase
LDEIWGGILRGLGTALGAIYEVVPSYVVAIIVLTIAVRVVLIPLTLKQIRSMAAMQKIQPEIKRLQQKHKGNRQKLNEEMMKLYKEHNVNPLGGCFPLLMQAPVFIALYSVLRASIAVSVALQPATQAVTIPINRTTFCRPATEAEVGTRNPTRVICETEVGSGKQAKTQTQPFTVDPNSFVDARTGARFAQAGFVTQCGLPSGTARGESISTLGCRSPIGTGHLPHDGKLFRDIVADQANFLGMHLACSPTQGSSERTIRQCSSRSSEAGGAPLVGYYALVALMVGTTYYQQRQMAQRAPAGPQQKQMQMMGRIMPIFLGFISLNIPAGVIVYWVASNVWTIGQQTVFFRRGHYGPPPSPPAKPEKKRS